MSKRILIVDDALFMRAMLQEIVINGGHEIIGEAANGVEALKQYRLLQPDLVFMDIIMPLRSGIEALQDITREDPQARVIVCSALGQEALLTEAFKAGARGYITKPFQEEEVLAAIDRACASTV
jgi:two-component system, chemotaxis family, chemotaxis protein CheY